MAGGRARAHCTALRRRLGRALPHGRAHLYAFPSETLDPARRHWRRAKRPRRSLVGACRLACRTSLAERHEKGHRGGLSRRHETGQKSMTTEIRHIVFDVGKVLVNWERDRPYREIIPDEAERRRFLEEICSMEWHQTLDEGAGIDDAIADLSARFPHEAERIRAYKSRWLDSIPSAIDGTVEILEALVAQGRDVTALTNFNQDLFRITREAYPFLDLFRGITVSGEQRLVKPDPAIFAHHAAAFGLEPAARSEARRVGRDG